MRFKAIENHSASRSFFQDTKRRVALLPDYVCAGLLHHQFNLVVGKRIYDMHSGLSEKLTLSGYMAPTVQRIFLAEESFSSKSASWIPCADPQRILLHEIGHFVDLFIDGTGAYPDGYASDSGEFPAAFRKDIENLEQTNFSALHKLHAGNPEREAYIQERFINSQTARRELYAELWAQNRKADMNISGMPSVFPFSAEIVRKRDKRFSAVSPSKKKL